MSLDQAVKRLISLHQRAEHHATQYNRLIMAGGAKSKSLRHQQKVEQLHSEISDLIRDCVWFGNDTGGKPPDFGFPTRPAGF
jgi:hypothetical protein